VVILELFRKFCIIKALKREFNLKSVEYEKFDFIFFNTFIYLNGVFDECIFAENKC